ncbi:MAG TPA: zincin-like metallopeptidase domain-containing protein [Thermoguttaceae bacterium]|nr:zincin-like metallopeptidase domain-containing protein [Thermoguttaceae bacterium]
MDQVEGAHLDRFGVGELEVNPDFSDFEPAEEAITATGADIRLGGGQASYHRLGDYICCPEKQRFPQEKEYYAALLHELAHWSEVVRTGLPRRLRLRRGRSLDRWWT